MSLDLARGPDFQRMTKGTPGDEVASCRVENVGLAILTIYTKREYIPSSASIK